MQKLAKLKNISQRPYLKTITLADLNKVIKEFDLAIKIINKHGKKMLVFNGKDPWSLLRLLDEDYLRSTLTGNKYEVTGKRIVH